MAEELTLTDPEVTPAVTNSSYQVIWCGFDWTGQHITFRLRGENGESLSAEYGGPMSDDAGRQQATSFMKYVNTANFSVNSMQKKILQKLSADGKIPPGTVTGTPDPVTP